MQLIDNLRSAVLQQREDEVSNFFSDVSDLREFISAREPGAGVNITVKMCCYNAERLSADNGSRITLVNSSAHGTFEEVQEALNELNSVNRKPFIAQVTVWDSKKKFGSPKSGRIHFRVGAVYEFKQVHSVGYFSDIAKGSVQLEVASSDRVVERLPPILKRKNAGEPSGRHPKARALLQQDESEEQKDGSGVESVAIATTARKRNAVASRG
ncbi:hypothetical protein PF010_g32601 [Phytophthora fragariae]|uniref:Uncharacterized protein n=1 Tax=Phytophthora fragariae TaxID=53985 RepID=A0A6G0JE24_9STRA|nr:hypothetical protein PF010_g32601 [Phytophthora fragariae]